MTVPFESAYLSLRQAVRPAMFAYRLLAGDAERAGRLAAECEDLLHLTRELLTAAGRARLLDTSPDPGECGEQRQAELLDAYADAAMGWAKVVGGLTALGGTLVERGNWDEVRRLADLLKDAGETRAATELRIRLGKAIWATYGDRLQRITSTMPTDEIGSAIATLRAVLREVPEDFPDRNREVNRLLAPLASAIHAVMNERGLEMPYESRVEHIATGGVAKYPDIVTTSLDELSAEFEGACR